MLLKGSCHCRKVQFQVESDQYYPYQLCYCSICRKTNGSGGFGINIKADAKTLKVEGKEHIRIYRAKLWDEQSGRNVPESDGERHFCKYCSSGLWLYDPQWPDMIHPFATAIDTPLPIAPRRTHIFLGSATTWVNEYIKPEDKCFDEYPDESIAQWHEHLQMIPPATELTI